MARHNRDGHGSDQRGQEYQINFQPDWLFQVKVTRDLESGRQSTKTLYRNPAPAEQSPGSRIRTRIVSAEQQLDFEIVIQDARGVVRRVIVETAPPGGGAEEGSIVFSIDGRNARPTADDD